MSHRTLVFLSGLTVGDYLLWNWSLGGNHVVLALVSGFSLLPLAVVCVLSLALALARLIAGSTRRRAQLAGRALRPHTRRTASAAASARTPTRESRPSTPRSANRSSRKLAA